MKQPPTIQSAQGQGPAYDPMDRIVEDLQNIENFIARLEMSPGDFDYLNKHLPPILAMRRTISHQLDMLSDEPYNYTPAKLKALHLENEKTFGHVEGVVGAMKPWDEVKFKRAVKATEDVLSKFDGDLTP